MTDKADETKDLAGVREVHSAPEAAQRGGAIANSGNQADWRTTQQARMREQEHSATDMFNKPGDEAKAVQKFAISGLEKGPNTVDQSANQELLAQALPTSQSPIPESIRQHADEEQDKQRILLDDAGNWQFQNPRLKPGKDFASELKEWIWNTLNPSPGKPAENNFQFAYQFLTGTGKTIQEHSDKNDPVLQDFIHSPGADAIRKQYMEQNCPAVTDNLNYGTYQAALETAVPHRQNPSDFSAFATTLPGDPPTDMVYPNLTSVAFQVGGFGNPPKEYPWAKAIAVRCDADGKADEHGNSVQYQVINLAGMHSFWLHAPAAHDKPLGETGPERTIIQAFSWIEPLPKKG